MYPRTTETGELVSELQMVDYDEHFVNKHRLLTLSGVIQGITDIPQLLLALDSLNSKPIKLVITSVGGDLDATFLLYDTIRLLRSPVWTLGRYCASAALLILAAGKKRYLMPHAKAMLHLPFGQTTGDARDWEIQHREMNKYKSRLVDILIECGAKPSKEQILADMDRDFWLEPEEVIAYGLADKVIDKKTLRRWFNVG